MCNNWSRRNFLIALNLTLHLITWPIFVADVLVSAFSLTQPWGMEGCVLENVLDAVMDNLE
jgi:hypothetical protein